MIRILLLGISLKRNGNMSTQKLCINIYSSIIHGSQEWKNPDTHQLIHKQNVVYSCDDIIWT